jgi:hypothetical protein
MTALAIVAAGLTLVGAFLVVVAQVLNPEQSPLALGMSGLARGRGPWVMKSAFVARGTAALLLVAALPTQLSLTGLALTGLALFWVWGVGSAALALADTDMPGEAPTPRGAAHALIAMVAYVAGVAGAIVLSAAMLGDQELSGAAVLALPLSIIAALALVVQFIAFGAAARSARADLPSAASATEPARPQTPAVAGGVGAASTAAAPPPLAGVPPRLAASPGAGRPSAAQGVSAGLAGALDDLGGYAGLFQRIFVGLLLAWTLLVALRVA